MSKPKFFKWVVEFQVDESWVADGFSLDDDGAEDMLATRLPYAYGCELKAKVLKEPSLKLIRQVQGYEK